VTTGLVIIGGGGLAREFHDIVEAINANEALAGNPRAWDFLGFVDASVAGDTRVTSRGPVLGGDEILSQLPADTRFIVAIANTTIRARVAAHAEAQGFTPAVLVHPNAQVGSRSVVLGPGTVVAANAILTTDVSVGRHVHIDRGVLIGHDCVLGDFVSVYPAAVIAGTVTMGAGSPFPSNAPVFQRLSIGAHAFGASGALAIRPVPSAPTAAAVSANPAVS